MSALSFDVGLASVGFIRRTQWFVTFRCGCTVDASLGGQPEQRAYFDARVRCATHPWTLPFCGPSYRAFADDFRPCAVCQRLCAPFPHRESETCSSCWWDAELVERMRA